MAPKSAAIRALEREVEQLKRQPLEKDVVITRLATPHALDNEVVC
jgi:hypothetical protein